MPRGLQALGRLRRGAGRCGARAAREPALLKLRARLLLCQLLRAPDPPLCDHRVDTIARAAPAAAAAER